MKNGQPDRDYLYPGTGWGIKLGLSLVIQYQDNQFQSLLCILSKIYVSNKEAVMLIWCHISCFFAYDYAMLEVYIVILVFLFAFLVKTSLYLLQRLKSWIFFLRYWPLVLWELLFWQKATKKLGILIVVTFLCKATMIWSFFFLKFRIASPSSVSFNRATSPSHNDRCQNSQNCVLKFITCKHGR